MKTLLAGLLPVLFVGLMAHRALSQQVDSSVAGYCGTKVLREFKDDPSGLGEASNFFIQQFGPPVYKRNDANSFQYKWNLGAVSEGKTRTSTDIIVDAKLSGFGLINAKCAEAVKKEQIPQKNASGKIKKIKKSRRGVN